MAGISIIKYKGVELYYVDYRYQSEEQMIKILDEACEMLIKENTPRPILVNLTKAFAFGSFVKESKERSKKTSHLVTKSAIVSDMSATRRVLISIVSRFIGGAPPLQMFDNEDDAKDYLVS